MAYGQESALQTIETEARRPRDVFDKLTGLQRATTYHARLRAQDAQQSGGPGCGEDRTFRTQSGGNDLDGASGGNLIIAAGSGQPSDRQRGVGRAHRLRER